MAHANPHLLTPQWKALRAYILERDNYTCVVPGCLEEATIVDHIKARNAGGTDDPDNLRSLCSIHDKQVKEFKRGKPFRRLGGVIPSPCDSNGMPLDPKHPWHRKRR